MGVILGTGGFLHNPEMVAEYDPLMVNSYPEDAGLSPGRRAQDGDGAGSGYQGISVIAVAGSWPLVQRYAFPVLSGRSTAAASWSTSSQRGSTTRVRMKATTAT